MFLRILLLSSISSLVFCSPVTITKEQAEEIALRIWQNECAKSCDGLTTWNKGEEFASVGIGHFVWYPAGKKGPFHEQFPEFIRFAESKGAILPDWLKKSTLCPWNTRDEFLKDFNGEKMVELRHFLMSTLALQATFITQKIEEVLPKITSSLSQSEKEHVSRMFFRVAQEPSGLYALIDYLNFKGEGTSPQERYQNQGWGLLQVLNEMQDNPSFGPIEEFVKTAKMILARRVKNAPTERNEEKWLKGWYNRLETYLPRH